ncbi:F0F1 ATP synthase subunit delta [Alphaproteobacteria bacterium KMM 3653]|uniref:ATP synthase subunit delta n=1 Tax=Harenicola maris TaxID=2841044 RepID=A0AAP2CUW6_9RHOB|nr:F0F1 ATP synthase subunit delta [Harenicola maris]
MSETASISASIATRYASALFALAKESKALPKLEGDIAALDAAVKESDDFNTLLSSPVYTREEQGQAITAIAKKMKLTALTTNTLALMASKRRLFVVPALVARLKDVLAEERGEVTAEVTSAKALSAAQQKSLAATLKKNVGKDVTLDMTVDESLIGGLIVKVGSKMIDSSIRSKLGSLHNAMKEVS